MISVNKANNVRNARAKLRWAVIVRTRCLANFYRFFGAGTCVHVWRHDQSWRGIIAFQISNHEVQKLCRWVIEQVLLSGF